MGVFAYDAGTSHIRAVYHAAHATTNSDITHTHTGIAERASARRASNGSSVLKASTVKRTKGHGGAQQPAIVLNQLMDVTRAAGAIGILGLYVTEDPGAKDEAARTGNLSLRFGLGWAKSHSFFTGQTPVMKYNRALMMAVLHDRIHIAKAVNATVIPLDQAPQGYADFDRGVARKFVIDPHGLLGADS